MLQVEELMEEKMVKVEFWWSFESHEKHVCAPL